MALGEELWFCPINRKREVPEGSASGQKGRESTRGHLRDERFGAKS